MAKAIKAIQCPKCGSPQKTELRPDVFRCDNCGTEYFLDNDDINVNYTVRHPPLPTTPAPAPQSRVLVGIIAVVALLLTFGTRYLFRSASTPSAPTTQYSVTTGSDDDYTSHYSFSADETLLYLAPTQKPVLLQVGLRRYDRVTKDSSYVNFVDGTTGKLLKTAPLPVPPGASSPDFDLKQFANGELYIIANKTNVYRVDKAAYTFKDVSKSLFQGQSELASGIATVEGGDDDYGDYFSVFTNDGRNLMFFPRLNKVYTKDAFYDARHGFSNLPANSATKTGFTFSRQSTTYPDDKIQLLKYQYRDSGGGPHDLPRFEWSDDYGGSGIFTDADPHVKRLITPYELKEARVLSYADFTPGRLYFAPALLYADAEYVLLAFKPTAAPTVATSLQCLNARTGAIMFTQPLPGTASPSEAIRYPAGFALRDGSDTYTLSLSGQLMKNPSLAL